ncbi:carboxypeptidase-like protein [Flavobacterium sp. 270]|uniref:carboxypeptidase-like regulatory domain-containing protein n=1 Tax=Flavobacterium sp. 270 TaxID=2512114 RepID=UPI0010646539|nr:carboxypeptidase-like regulatory domain-containing protein [Flavobacterium sp. 270]TDW51545.1 carboxypeptidase-like protein [Flavobacterium sp. 270]
MKKLTIFVFLFSAVNLFAQNILKGKITNKDNKPLEGVNVFFDGTTISTVSDENGNFKIKLEPNTNNILVISSIGYQTEYLTSFDTSKDLNVLMTVAKNELKEVVITKNELFTRAQKLKLFREYFIGKTKNAKGTIIKNEDEIRFKYDKDKFIFTAYSDKPLVIVNSLLGYKIDFELVDFEIAFKKLSIAPIDVIKNYYGGVSRFEEIENTPEILERREKTFEGSQLQFFRNLANEVWDKKKFLLFTEEHSLDPKKCFKVTKEDDFVKVDLLPQPKDQVKYDDLNVTGIVASYFLMYNRDQESRITFLTDSFKIYKYGNNSDIESVLFSGKISEKKVGDMLPLNFNMK